MRNRNFVAIITCVLLCFNSCKSEVESTDTLDTHEMIEYCVSKAQETSDALSETNEMPRNVEQGESKWKNVGIHDWTSGFWPGILWLSYETSKNPLIQEKAKAFTGLLEKVLDRPVDNHDLGFS